MGKVSEQEHGEPEDLISKMVERMGIWHLSVGQAVRMRINSMTEQEAAEVRDAMARVNRASGAELQKYFQMLDRIDESHIEQQADSAIDLVHDIASMLLEQASAAWSGGVLRRTESAFPGFVGIFTWQAKIPSQGVIRRFSAGTAMCVPGRFSESGELQDPGNTRNFRG